MRKPWLCRIGLHTSIYSDGAMFTSADRCNKCGEWVDKDAGAKVDRERALWTKYGEDDSTTAMGKVARALYLGRE